MSIYTRLVTRALLLPVGEQAGQMTETVLTLSREWLGGEAPLRMGSVQATSQNMNEEMAAMLDELASQSLLQSLAGQGVGIARPNEAEVWAIVDLSNGTSPDLEATRLSTLLQALAELAWQRLRIHLAAHALLLATPADQPALITWVDALAAPCENRIYLAGPVNESHTYLTKDTWLNHTAISLAALLWSKAPGHSHLGHQTMVGRTVVALGGVAWMTPRSALNHWLSLTFAHEFVNRLRQDTMSAPDHQDKETAGAEQRMREMAETLTAPPAGLVWGERRPDLRALADLPHTLVQETERVQRQRDAEAQRGRQRWLSSQLESWTKQQEELQQAYLRPSTGWPRLPANRARLSTHREMLLQQLQVVQSHLDEWGERWSQAEEASKHAQNKLAELCRLIPTPDWRGGLTVLTQPWRMVSWLWAYLVWLPQRAQQLLDALARQAMARWHENNWHTLRQLFLVQAQECQLALDKVTRLTERLAGVDQVLTTALERVDNEEMSPWAGATLEHLHERLLADGSTCGLAFLAAYPLDSWDEIGVDRLYEALRAWPQPWLDPLSRWDGVDHLVEALPGPGLSGWFSGQVETAQSLWPSQEMCSGTRGETRLLLGVYSAHGEGVDPGHGERLERLREAARELDDLMESTFYGDGVAMLRLTLVDLEMDTPNLEPESDEPG